jgi:GT2 family glycosyltransferase
MSRITFAIPTKNNLRYLKSSVESIRENSSQQNDIIVYIDSDNDGTEEWLKENNVTFIKNESDTVKGIAHGYNRCIELAKTPIVCMFHADMYMAKGFDTGILKHLLPGTVVAGTRIEPPLHPEGKEKIVKNFGMYPEDFKKKEFDSYVETVRREKIGVTTRGIFAPWAIYKDDITKIGMHDETFHSYHEDSDIFNRFILNGYNLIQSWEAYVYHLTCRGGQFQDGIEKITTDEMFHKMKDESFRKYIKKWGSGIMNDEFHYPILYPKFDISVLIKNSNDVVTKQLKPFFTEIVTDTSASDNADVYVEIDLKTFTQEDFKNITNINGILGQLDSDEVGSFELGNIFVKVNKLKDTSRELIICK